MLADDEAFRQRSVDELGLLDTDPEAEFDELVQLAAAICETPIGAMTLIDRGRVWNKAHVGISNRETPREFSICNHAVQSQELFIIEDARQDARFANNPHVLTTPGVRFYAGMPLETPNGCRVGTLCVVDQVPRRLTAVQQNALVVLARQLKVRMAMRLQRRTLESTLRDREVLTSEMEGRERRFRAFMDHSPFVGYMKAEDGRYEYYNKRFADLFCIDGHTWLGTRDTDHFSREQAASYRANDLRALDGMIEIVVTETTIELDGSTKWWESHKFGYMDPSGRRLLGGVSVDVTREYLREIELQASKLELEERNAQLKSLTLIDALTGLKNRRAFEERLKLEFLRAQRTGQTLSLVMLDIDFFKRVNDDLGHGAGDTVLCEVAQVLRASVRTTDMAARFGGEEFAVILSDTDAANALLWARRLELTLTQIPWKHRPVTLSMGISELGPTVYEAVQLVQRADESLYAAKRGGRAKTVVYGRAIPADAVTASRAVMAAT